MTKVSIISGFLGAGKTTFIKKLLEEVYTNQKIVLIENEFGEIGIDGGFLKDAGVQINEMNSGCICCSLVGDFGEALKKVAAEYTPDLIIIEPSGVGKLSDVIAAVENVKEEAGLELDSFITVADGTKCKMYMKNFGEFYNNQIENASTIVLSRTQNMTEEKLVQSIELIREHNEKAAIITTPWSELTGEMIVKAFDNKSLAEELLEELEVCPCCGHHHHDHEEHEHHHHEDGEECCCGHHHEHEHHHHHEDGEECCCGHHHEHEHHHHEHGEECCCGHHHHDHEEHEHHHHHHHGHHHADDVFTSWGVETPHKYSKDQIEEILKKLVTTEEYGIVLRAKGMVPSTDDSWIYFDAVPGEYELREGTPEYTGKLCVIGTNICEHAMEELFDLK